MANLPVDLPALLSRAGFRGTTPAVPKQFSSVESAFGITIPDDFRELWTLSDGMPGDGIELLSLSGVKEYAGVFEGGLGYLPFGDCNDSNPYVVCCREPLRGVVAHIFHDGEPGLICRGLERFLDLVAQAQHELADVSLLTGDFDFSRPDRTAEDAAVARELIRVAQNFDRSDRFWVDALRFAAQLFGPGQEDELTNLMTIGDEYTREAVIHRLKGLGTSAAEDQLRKDKAEFDDFLMQLKNRFEAAGFHTETDRRGNFRLQPGDIGPNLTMLFGDRHRPGAMDEWIERFKDRAGVK